MMTQIGMGLFDQVIENRHQKRIVVQKLFKGRIGFSIEKSRNHPLHGFLIHTQQITDTTQEDGIQVPLHRPGRRRPDLFIGIQQPVRQHIGTLGQR